MAQKKSLLVTGGFVDSQFAYLLPVVDGYCRAQQIEQIIFESPIPHVVAQSPIGREILDRYDIAQPRKSKKLRFVSYVILAVVHLFPAINLAHATSRRGLISRGDWYRVQLLHAVWDHALQGLPDGVLEISFFRRLLSAARVLIAVSKIRELTGRENVKSAFLGHTVYASRGILAELRVNNVDIIAHGAHVFYRVPRDYDTSWGMLTSQEWSALFSITDKNIEKNFWKKRKNGDSSYLDAQVAAVRSREVTSNTARNIIMLHTFRDSPYNYIDTTRIFADYVDWVRRTLEIIGSSEEKWLVKFHPSALRWGENQETWIQNIGTQVFGAGRWPKQIEISALGYSNVDLFRSADRVVTYSGTSHLEAACWGIRPLVISQVTLGSFDASSILKPSTESEYAELLLLPGNSAEFQLSTSQKLAARRVLFAREKMLRFQEDVGEPTIYRGDDRHLLEQAVVATVNRMPGFARAMTLLGGALATGLPRTVSLSYSDQWRKAAPFTPL